MSELKPCPFCGSADAPEASVMKFNMAVICSLKNGGCGASSAFCRTENEAINAWNRRVEDERR